MLLVNPLESSEKYVYHYTKLDTALKYILKTGTLMLNSFSKVNDPRESKSWTITTTVRSDLDLELEDWDTLSQLVSDMLKQNVKVVCFCKDRARAVNQWQVRGPIDRGFAKPSMWHHYANGHNGVCLVFDREKLDASFKRQINKDQLVSGSVTYSDEGSMAKISNSPFSIDLTQIDSEKKLFEQLKIHLNRWMPSLFFTKLEDWNNEEEYRWVYFDNHENPLCLNFDDALAAIVIGESVSKDHKESMLMYCAKYKANIANLEWRNGCPALINSGSPYITHRHLLENLEGN
ncbi:MAG: DUF2971 domain-containing protein [Xenococcus sp. MO_188.B8]|nr:DUF2971 domain-containing protein [Xenococcus sp. MO_188.B8]